MISLLLIFTIYVTLFTRNEEYKNNDESVYSIIAASLSLGTATNGLFGLAFIFLKLTYFPLSALFTFILLLLLYQQKHRKNLFYFVKALADQFEIIYKNYKKSNFFKIVIFFVFLMIFASIGPINHSDAVNGYVGLPYKFWLRNSHFIDGNLYQGLLGIGDFSNIFYFQDQTTWLIRTTQFLSIIPILFLILKRNTNKLIVLIIFSTPVFIQWFTIGKTNFLSESCLSILFLVWENKRQYRDLILLISLSLISISFKISALLICIPIFLYLLFVYKNKIRKINFALLKDYRLSGALLISISCLIAIFLYRYYIFENPFYPLLSEIFTPDNQQLIDFEQMLRSWNRTGFFHFWVFLPKSIGKISYVLGPANFALFIFSLFCFIRNYKSEKEVNFVIGLAQFFMLLLFAQGSADYYAAPILITYCGSKKINQSLISTNKLFTKNFLKIAIFAQVFMFIISSFYMIFISLYVLWDHEKGMDRFAWNYYNSKYIMEKAERPVMNNFMAMSDLYYDDEFISTHRFGKCFYYENNFKKNRYELCVSNLGIKTIIVDKDELAFNDNFLCDTHELLRVSRNIFLSRKKEVDFCRLK